MPELPAGTIFADHEILAVAGRGGMAVVYRARHAALKREVALKVIAPEYTSDPEFRTRFQRECEAAASVQHPNVVSVYHAGEEDGRLYVTMRFVEGTDLRALLAREGRIDAPRAVTLIGQIAGALDEAHAHGLVHRDVKPANILAVVQDGEVVDVKLSDFGSVLNTNSDRTQIHRVGSLAYMSPEQIEGNALDCRTDIYALAAVLYHLISGRPPFDAQTQVALMNQIFHNEPPPLTSLREGVTPALENVILGALAKNREDRPQDWESFAQALSGLIVNHQVPRGRLQKVLDSERFNLLRSLDFFSAFDDVELWEVVHRAKWLRLHYGHRVYRRGQEGNTFHIIAQGEVEVFRDGQRVARLGAGTSVGEMAYLAPSPDLRRHSADIIVSEPCTTVSFTPESLTQLSADTRMRFDKAFIQVLVRRLHAAHETLAHPRRVL